MNLQKFELWVHDHLLKNDKIRHFLYGVYQRIMWLLSPKFKSTEGIERVTPDDGYEYFFGYYDKCPWSPNNRYILSLRVKNATKKADSSEKADIVTIDLENNKKMTIVAQTHCWNVQQGCMAQWMDDDRIIYNDFRDGNYCSVILNLKTKEERIISMPIYTLSDDKKTALTLDFSRLHRLRPGYGYCNIVDKTKNEKCPDTTCIWQIDIDSGTIMPLLKYTDFLNFEQRAEMIDAEHKVNHLMINPAGTRFIVLHRWFKNKKKYTRLVTCNIDGTDLYNLSDDDFTSHCFWINEKDIISYLGKSDGGKGYYLLEDKSNNYQRKWSSLLMDGHPSYSSKNKLFLTDNYPDRKRVQTLYLMNNNEYLELAKVFSPFKYKGDCRCDLHPRWSRDGNKISFDGCFDGKKALYTIDKPQQGSFNKLSIIIPVYNASKTLRLCLDSIIKQTSPKWEIIAIDDGSSDNSYTILKEYAEIDNRIIIAKQDNAGPGMARNRGLQMATGDYIAFLDSDDYYSNNFVQKIEEKCLLSEFDVLFYNMQYEKENGSIIRKTNIKRFSTYNIFDIVSAQMAGYLPWSACVKVIKRKIIDENQCVFNQSTVGEEAIFSFNVLRNARNIIFTDDVFYHYINYSTGQHTKLKEDPWQGVAFTLKEELKTLGEFNTYQSAFNCLLYKALSISLYRIANHNSYLKALVLMRKKIKEYNTLFSLGKINTKYIDKKTRLIKLFIQCHLITPIYIASITRRKGQI